MVTSYSDHHLIFASISLNPLRLCQPLVRSRCSKAFDCENFRSHLSSQPWNLIQSFSDVNDMWNYWKSLFLAVLNNHAPFKLLRRRRNSLPWISPDIPAEMEARDRIHQKAIKSGDSSDWSLYKNRRNRVNLLVRTAKAKYFQDLLKRPNPKSHQYWQVLNLATKRKMKTNSLLPLSLDALADHFSSVVSPVAVATDLLEKSSTVNSSLISPGRVHPSAFFCGGCLDRTVFS